MIGHFGNVGSDEASPMRVFYNSATTNFGDHLNSWLWKRLIPNLLEQRDDNVLVGVGSLLKADLNRVPGRKYIVGSGSGYGQPPTAKLASDWNVSFVRGPLTAKMFGFSPETAITDGAWLIELLAEYQKVPARGNRTIFIPHWSSAQYGVWQKIAGVCDIDYINPLDDGPSVLHRIATARIAIVESLHGAIFADYFRTPWIPVASAGRVLHFKWVDWCMSLGMDHLSYTLPPSDCVDFLLQGLRPTSVLPEIRVRTH
jgi:succinoglycan biosynthesis protein ExoV